MVELEDSSSYVTTWKPALESFAICQKISCIALSLLCDVSRIPQKGKFYWFCVSVYKELWGRGVLRTIQEELLELIIVKYSVPFFFIYFYNWLSTLFCSCLYFKKLSVFAFLQTKWFCIPWKRLKEKKRCLWAEQWGRGEETWEGGSQENAATKQLFCLPAANPSFCSSRELCEPVLLIAVA